MGASPNWKELRELVLDIGGGELKLLSREVDREGVEPALCLSPILDNNEGVY